MPFPVDGVLACGRANLNVPEGGNVRKVIQWTLVPVAILAVACGKSNSRASTAMSDDLKKDLQLASHTQDIQISPDEVAPKSHQDLALRPKKAPDGKKVIRTDHPTVKASATQTQVAEVKSEIPQVQVMASAPAPSETPSDGAPPMARPASVPTQGYPGASPIPASNNGSVLGGIFGAVIRGGIVGDDDHCDPRPRPRGGRPIGGDIYSLPGTSGMGGARFPVMMPRRGR